MLVRSLAPVPQNGNSSHQGFAFLHLLLLDHRDLGELLLTLEQGLVNRSSSMEHLTNNTDFNLRTIQISLSEQYRFHSKNNADFTPRTMHYEYDCRQCTGTFLILSTEKLCVVSNKISSKAAVCGSIARALHTHSRVMPACKESGGMIFNNSRLESRIELIVEVHES